MIILNCLFLSLPNQFKFILEHPNFNASMNNVEACWIYDTYSKRIVTHLYRSSFWISLSFCASAALLSLCAPNLSKQSESVQQCNLQLQAVFVSVSGFLGHKLLMRCKRVFSGPWSRFVLKIELNFSPRSEVVKTKISLMWVVCQWPLICPPSE